MAIAFNGNYNIPQPSAIKEGKVRHVHDRVSITGVARRIWMADKRQVELTFSAVSLSQYNTLAAYIYNGSSAITYSDSVTGFTFVGFASAAEDVFLPGASYLRNVTVTILEQ